MAERHSSSLPPSIVTRSKVRAMAEQYIPDNETDVTYNPHARSTIELLTLALCALILGLILYMIYMFISGARDNEAAAPRGPSAHISPPSRQYHQHFPAAQHPAKAFLVCQSDGSTSSRQTDLEPKKEHVPAQTPSKAGPSRDAGPLSPPRSQARPKSPRKPGKPRFSDPKPPSRSLEDASSSDSDDEPLARNHPIGVTNRLLPWQRMDLKRIIEREEAAEEAQKRGILNQWRGTLLKWDTGMGKTILTIALISCTLSKAKMPTLILCPNAEIMEQWHKEIKTFASHLRICFYHSSDTPTNVLNQREPSHLEDYDVVLATYNQVSSQHAFMLKYNAGHALLDTERWPFFLIHWYRVVADESHLLRSHDGKRSNACLTLFKQFGLLLSATPIQNGPSDLYAQFLFLGREYPSLKEDHSPRGIFTTRHALPWEAGNGKLLLDILRDVCIYRTKSCLGLPARLDHRPHAIRLTRAERELYQYAVDSIPRDKTLALLVRLRQACVEPRLLQLMLEKDEEKNQIYDEDDLQEIAESLLEYLSDFTDDGSIADSEASVVPEGETNLPMKIAHLGSLFGEGYVSTKIRTVHSILKEILRRPYNEKTIVYSHFKSPLYTLSRILSATGIGHVLYTGDLTEVQRSGALKTVATNDPCQVLLMTIQSGGMGLNITSCNNVIFMEPWWNPYVEEQAVGRVHRIGQTRPVHVYRIIAEDTIESQNMVPIRDSKKENIDRLFDAFLSG